MFEGSVELCIVFPESPLLQMALLAFALIMLTLAFRTTSRSMVTIAETKDQLNEVTQRLATLQDALRTREEHPESDEDSLHPSRSTSDQASYHPRSTGQQWNQAMRRTRSFSAHVFTNGARPIKNAPRLIRDQFTMMGREVLRPMRTSHHLSEPPILDNHYTLSAGDSSDSGRSSTDSERRTSIDSDSSATTANSAPSSDVSLSPLQKDVRSVTHPRIALTRRSAEMSLSTPSTPDRARRSEQWTPSSKSAICRTTTGKNGEPIRYARPARPEHSLPGVVFETRYENPLKSMFRVKTRGNSDHCASPKSTKARESRVFLKSSPSIRRLFGSASDTCSERESSEDSDRSRRSSLSSTTTAPTSNRSSTSTESEAEKAGVPVQTLCGEATPFDAAPGCAATREVFLQ
ncbi:hypothetical protein C2E23DRAFT_880041 [Lenzites betulinus]|nr:hypothetical protein C2E23DRAFT_880041 [Lenzites betulinus]